MIFLTALNWFTSKKEYLENAVGSTDDPDEIERRKKLASKFWNSIDMNDVWMVLIMVTITFAICYAYFIPFNNRPGRHYLPSYCALFGICSILLSFGATLLYCSLIVKLSYDTSFVMKVAAINATYSLLLYLILSFIFCNYSNTNAYRWFKI